jgi:S-adenosylmethionine hydrolase
MVTSAYSLHRVYRSYSEVAAGEALLLVDSSGFLELAVNQGNGAALLKLGIGDRIELKVK